MLLRACVQVRFNFSVTLPAEDEQFNAIAARPLLPTEDLTSAGVLARSPWVANEIWQGENVSECSCSRR